MTAEKTPSISALLYLHSDRVVGRVRYHTPEGERRGEIQVPCKDGLVVDGFYLAPEMLASAHWSLREQDLLELELIQNRTWISESSSLRAGSRSHQERLGLEGEMLAAIEAGRSWSGDELGKILAGWIGPRKWWGRIAVPQIAAREAADLGFGEMHETDIDPDPPYIGVATPGVRFNPNCERIASLKDKFDAEFHRWTLFQEHEEEQFRILLEKCRDGIGCYDADQG